MFPEPEDFPALRLQSLRDNLIALLIALELLFPKGRIGARHGLMFGTTVPKTSVYEHCNLQSGKNHIRTPRNITPVNTEAQSFRMQYGAKGLFRLRVCAAYTAHIQPPLLGRENVRHIQTSLFLSAPATSLLTGGPTAISVDALH